MSHREPIHVERRKLPASHGQPLQSCRFQLSNMTPTYPLLHYACLYCACRLMSVHAHKVLIIRHLVCDTLIPRSQQIQRSSRGDLTIN
ncbi:hypothetical protein E2C01_032077 [Portunus trituberculatus]|uniref:Uncharacterized protein n=1 Tax=Portunus trituberculatus TaxID=210409 RepID=A0A5B7EZZ6_PORTR|nr:hypothetical protein [Portunus trituberculatus]